MAEVETAEAGEEIDIHPSKPFQPPAHALKLRQIGFIKQIILNSVLHKLGDWSC